MPAKSRLILAITACLLLSNCGLIDTALRLAPYYLLFADDSGQVKAVEMRGREVQDKKLRRIQPMDGNSGSQVAFKH